MQSSGARDVGGLVGSIRPEENLIISALRVQMLSGSESFGFSLSCRRVSLVFGI